jgi:hypothetical protein
MPLPAGINLQPAQTNRETRDEHACRDRYRLSSKSSPFQARRQPYRSEAHAMSAPALIETALELADAAADVVATWEVGDLAQAVRWLDETLRAFNAAYSASNVARSPSSADELDGSRSA